MRRPWVLLAAAAALDRTATCLQPNLLFGAENLRAYEWVRLAEAQRTVDDSARTQLSF